jgi:hypothetical protein
MELQHDVQTNKEIKRMYINCNGQEFKSDIEKKEEAFGVIESRSFKPTTAAGTCQASKRFLDGADASFGRRRVGDGANEVKSFLLLFWSEGLDVVDKDFADA